MHLPFMVRAPGLEAPYSRKAPGGPGTTGLQPRTRWTEAGGSTSEPPPHHYAKVDVACTAGRKG